MAQTHINPNEEPPTRTEEAARCALDTLMKITDTSVPQIQAALKMKTRQSVYDKLSGKTRINLKDIDRLTAFFEIPPYVLFMEKAELLSWMGANLTSDQAEGVSPRIHEWAAAA